MDYDDLNFMLYVFFLPRAGDLFYITQDLLKTQLSSSSLAASGSSSAVSAVSSMSGILRMRPSSSRVSTVFCKSFIKELRYFRKEDLKVTHEIKKSEVSSRISAETPMRRAISDTALATSVSSSKVSAVSCRILDILGYSCKEGSANPEFLMDYIVYFNYFMFLNYFFYWNILFLGNFKDSMINIYFTIFRTFYYNFIFRT